MSNYFYETHEGHFQSEIDCYQDYNKEEYGYEIKASKNGWLISGWRKNTEGTGEFEYFLPYTDSFYKYGVDLGSSHDAKISIGEYIYQNERRNAKILNRRQRQI